MKKLMLGTLIMTCIAMLLVAEDSSTGSKISAENAKALLASDETVVLLDVRTAEEFSSGHIEKSILLPYDQITAATAAKAIPSKATTIIVYCRTGRRSSIAAKTLHDLGYKTVRDLGGIVSWPYEIVR